jgi:mRNA interferase MazF
LSKQTEAERAQQPAIAAEIAPAPGQILWFDVGPSVGHEQDGWRPVVVISPQTHNRMTGTFVGVIITSRIRGWPTEVSIEGLPKESVALASQFSVFDWRARKLKSEGQVVSAETLSEIRERVCVICGMEDI